MTVVSVACVEAETGRRWITRIVSQRVVYEKRFLDGWVVPDQAITADSLTA
jgi:hypothetical protein